MDGRLVFEGDHVKNTRKEQARLRWVLWHVTARCNMNCKYCYGTFDGASYMHNGTPDQELGLAALSTVAEQIASLGFEFVHVCGGEPLLREDIVDLARCLKRLGLKTFVLTNGVADADLSQTRELLKGELVSNLSFSLDSLDVRTNDYLRGMTEEVKRRIKIACSIARETSVEIGLYVVLTKINVDDLARLLEWAVSVGVSYVNAQIVYLPTHHRYFSELSLSENDRTRVTAALEALERYRGRIRVSSRELISLTDALLSSNRLTSENCFAGHDFLYVDAAGNLFPCPTLPKLESPCLGSLEQPVSNSIRSAVAAPKLVGIHCNSLTAACLGMYEMVYMEWPEACVDIGCK